MTTYQISLVLFTLCCIISAIISTLKQLNIIEIKEPSVMVKVYCYPLEIVYNYVLAVLENFYEFILFVVERFFRIYFHKRYLYLLTLLPLVKDFTNPKHSIYYFIFLLSLRMLPRIMFVTALLYDVFLCKRFDYTFKCIPLLLIPLLEEFFLFMLKHYYKVNVFKLASFLKYTKAPNSDQIFCSLHTEDQILPYGAKDLDDFIDNYLYPVDQILLTVEKYTAWKTEKIPTYYILLILQMLRLNAYCYILFYGIL